MRVFIRTNNKQILGAKLGKYAILRATKNPNIRVDFINVDEIPLFAKFEGAQYLRGGRTLTYTLDDLQSFTLAAFIAPELAGYQGLAVVIDPDIFACTDMDQLFAKQTQEHPILARPKRGFWDTSVMLLQCDKLRHWNMAHILDDLRASRTSYEDWMSLKHETVGALPPEWNSWDALTANTKLLHTTNRLTQPWKTGLPIDFTRERQFDRFFGVIPKPWILRLVGKWPTRYQPHPDKHIEQFFFGLVRDALNAGAVSETEIQDEITAGHVRPDLIEKARRFV